MKRLLTALMFFVALCMVAFAVPIEKVLIINSTTDRVPVNIDSGIAVHVDTFTITFTSQVHVIGDSPIRTTVDSPVFTDTKGLYLTDTKALTITDTKPFRGLDTVFIVNASGCTVICMVVNNVSITNVPIQDTIEWMDITTDSDIWFKFTASLTPDSGFHSGAFPILTTTGLPYHIERRMTYGTVSAVANLYGDKANVYILCGRR